MPTFTLDEAEHSTLNLSLTMACDDFADEIAKDERRNKTTCDSARKTLAAMQRLKIKLNPSCLCGDWRIADGSVIKPGDY